MVIYVYQLPDRTYGAGLDELACALRGRIVERWPVNTPQEAKFVSSHGSAFAGVSDKVVRLANLTYELLMEHPELKRTRDIKQTASRLGFWKRVQLALYIIFRIERIEE